MNYSILENLTQRVYKHQGIRDVQHLKDSLNEKWEELPQYEIDACINQVKHRLRKVIEESICDIENFSKIPLLGECVNIDLS